MDRSSSMSCARNCTGERDRLIDFARSLIRGCLHKYAVCCLWTTCALFTIVMIVMPTALRAQEHPAADTIITNANVWTVDRNHPRAEAVAILGQRIAAVGSSVDMDAWRGPQTRVVDGAGKLLLPGFNDAHTHFMDGGFQLDQVQLTDARTREEFVNRILDQAKKLKKGEWILGGDWDEQNWSPPELPTHD